MLRRVLLVAAVLLAGCALWLLARHIWVPGMQVLIAALLLFVGTAFEAWRYRKGPGPMGARWQHTDERFADPITGEEMAVEYDPVCGERRYVKR